MFPSPPHRRRGPQGALSREAGRRGGVRAGLWASRRRAPRPRECATRQKKAGGPCRLRRSRQSTLRWSPRSNDPRVQEISALRSRSYCEVHVVDRRHLRSLNRGGARTGLAERIFAT